MLKNAKVKKGKGLEDTPGALYTGLSVEVRTTGDAQDKTPRIPFSEMPGRGRANPPAQTLGNRRTLTREFSQNWGGGDHGGRGSARPSFTGMDAR